MKFLHDVQLWPRPGADGRLLASLRQRRRRWAGPSALVALLLPVSLTLLFACVYRLPGVLDSLETACGRRLFGAYDLESAACALIAAWSLLCGLGLLYVVVALIRYHRIARLLLRLRDALADQGLLPSDDRGNSREALAAPMNPGFLGRTRRFLRIGNSDAAVMRRARRALRWRWLSLGSTCVFLLYALAGATVLPAELGGYAPTTPTSAGTVAVALAAATGSILGVATVLGYRAFLALLVGHASRRTDELVLRYHDILAGEGALPDDLKQGDGALAGKAGV